MSKSPIYVGAGSAELAVQAALNLIQDSEDSSASLAVFQSLFHGSSTTTPTLNVSDGDLWFDTTSGVNNMKVYDVGTTSWISITYNAIGTSNFTYATLVTQSDGIASNDNETTIPTSAAVKDYVDTQITAEDLDIAADTGTAAVD